MTADTEGRRHALPGPDGHLDPRNLPEQERAQLLAEEKQWAQELQRQGVWLHLWRVAGRYSNISIFDVDSNDTLHKVL